MAAMKISKEQPPAKRRAIDPPSSFVTSSLSSSPPPPRARVSTTGGSPHVPSSSSTSPAGMLPTIFPIPHMKMSEVAPPPLPVKPFLRSSMLTSSGKTASSGGAGGGPQKPRKSVRYAFVQIYEHDLEKPVRRGVGDDASAAGGRGGERVQSYELTEYEAQRGPRRSPKFFQKSDQERQGLRKLRELEERQAEQEWRQIRQETISIQEEASIMSAPGGGGGGGGSFIDSGQSVRSESSFANASFYEGFEDKFKAKRNHRKNKVSLGSRFGRFFRRRFSVGGGRHSTTGGSMIDEM
jgi:hypothetical protein